jgi:hypothetical protein
MKKSVINYPKEKVICICSYTTDECLLITDYYIAKMLDREIWGMHKI